ncbi:unnamed protein product [Rhodiola kirilowii]
MLLKWQVPSYPVSKKVNSGYTNVSGQPPATVAVKIESPKLGAQVDAKQNLPIGNSGKASTNFIESSKRSEKLSTAPDSPVAAVASQESAQFNRVVKGSHDDSTNPLKKPDDKKSAQDEPLGASTTSPLGIIIGVKPSGSDTVGDADNKSDITSKTLHEKSTCRAEPPSNDHTSSKGISVSTADDAIEQKNELPTYTTHDRHEGSANIHSVSGAYANDSAVLRTESEHSYVDNVEIGEPFDKPASDAVLSVALESSLSSDGGSNLDFDLSTNPEAPIKSAIPDADLTLRNDGGGDKNVVDVAASFLVTGSKDKVLDLNRPKSASSKGKKKMKEFTSES